MKIIFDDRSYIDCYKSNQPGKIMIAISAKDATDPLKKITNAVELSVDEFKKLISDVSPSVGFYVKPPENLEAVK
jgi:hypothetical protein